MITEEKKMQIIWLNNNQLMLVMQIQFKLLPFFPKVVLIEVILIIKRKFINSHCCPEMHFIAKNVSPGDCYSLSYKKK